MISRSTTVFCRLFLVCLVVVNHCVSGKEILFQFTSPALALLSGFLFTISFKSFTEKFKSIFKSLIIPYVVINAVYYFIYLIGKRTLLTHSLGGLFIRPAPNFSTADFLNQITLEPANGPFWYLRDLIVAHTALNFIFLFNQRIRFLFSILLMIGCSVLQPNDRFYNQYCLGVFLGLTSDCRFVNFIKFEKWAETNINFKGISVSVALALIVLYLNHNRAYCGKLLNPLLGLMTVLFFYFMGPFVKIDEPFYFEKFSFFIFSFHALIIGVVKLILSLTGFPKGLFNNIFLFLIAFGLSLLLFEVCRFFRWNFGVMIPKIKIKTLFKNLKMVCGQT